MRDKIMRSVVSLRLNSTALNVYKHCVLFSITKHRETSHPKLIGANVLFCWRNTQRREGSKKEHLHLSILDD
jgi:hypothetical protein